MDFDLSKENIQPLRGGRNVQQLGMALQAQSNREYQLELLQQKEQFENIIRNYDGDDPLENYYNFISWVEQSYPKHGHEGNLVPLLEHCLSLFENDKRYLNDRRFCKLWIKYFDLQQNPLELYHMMRAKGLCRGCADLYKAWAYYYEAAGDFQSANNVFEDGKRALAQPYEELENAHQSLIMAAGQHVLFGPDENRLIEKRQALTSLHTYRPGRVGSVRVPSSNGVVTLPSNSTMARSNTAVFVYEDNGEVAVTGAEAAPLSIITVARRQEAPKENTLKPGPWTTLPVKKQNVGLKSTPGFTVLEDFDISDGIRLPANHPKESLEDYANWRVSIKYPEPPNPAMIPMYPKDRVYIDPNTEYSIDELRAPRYLRKMTNRLHVPQVETCQAVQSILDGVEVMQESLHEFKNDISPEMSLFRQNEVHRLPEQNDNLFLQDGSQKTLQEQINPNFHRSPNQSTFQENNFLLGTNQQHLFQEQKMEEPETEFAIWNNSSPGIKVLDFWSPSKSKPTSNNFVVYEQSLQDIHPQMQPKGSAMKTVFKDLNAEELAETGSRGGMDIAATAQAADSAKRMPLFSDNSSSSYEDLNPDRYQDLENSCNTQMFNFNLNVMQVSTPQNKRPILGSSSEDVGSSRKQLFMEPKVQEKDKALSTIMEETKSYGSTSSSSGATTKSSLFNNHTNKMGTISEEHNSYLAQNLMANAALRSSLLGNLMDFEAPHSPLVLEEITTTEPTIPMQSSPFGSPVRIPAPAIVKPLDHVPSDPFKTSLINELLQRVAFPGPHTFGYITLPCVPRISCTKKETISIGNEKYLVEKQLGKGTFGTVFKAMDLTEGKPVALKFQKPANKWEFYICRELQARLADHPLRENFMDVTIGFFGDQASVLVSDYMPGGSLLDLANTYKLKSSKSMKECLVKYFTIQMLKIVQAMHEVNIIHADIKPDNFLVYVLPDNTVGLQLIDFGCSIDMTLFPPNACFTRRVTTENFVCCEMLDGRPWNYHTDLFCIAATTHVLLFDAYIKLRKQDGLWSITHRFARYMQVDVWNIFFSDLLNQQSRLADSKSLLHMLTESLNIKENNTELRYVVNLLKNR